MSDISIKTIKELHNFGVTGKGIKVAIIDSSFAKANDKLKIKQTINLDNVWELIILNYCCYS